jgi:hypothetical protein
MFPLFYSLLPKNGGLDKKRLIWIKTQFHRFTNNLTKPTATSEATISVERKHYVTIKGRHPSVGRTSVVYRQSISEASHSQKNENPNMKWVFLSLLRILFCLLYRSVVYAFFCTVFSTSVCEFVLVLVVVVLGRG